VARSPRSPFEVVAQNARLRLRRPRGGARAVPAILALEGEFDLDTVPQIDRFLRRHLGPLYYRDHLVIDLAGATFIDSSFIGFLAHLVRDLRAMHKELVLVRPAGQVRRVLGVVGLPNVVPIYDTLPEAVEALRGDSLPAILPKFGRTSA
jgi:anti-anti-sigma factor